MADVFNIFNSENFTREYIKKVINDSNKDVDTSDGSAFDDLFITPLVPIVERLISTLSSIELKSNLKNANLMSEEELDEIGVNNYFITRQAGSKAQGTAIFVFGRIQDDTSIVIPQGTVLVDDSETYRFVTSVRVILTHDDLISYYSSDTNDYRVPVPITATNEGSGYNLGENKITKCLTHFSSLLTSVTNPVSTTGGEDRETNTEYAERISRFYSSQHLGTSQGYLQDVLENTNIQTAKIVGKGDPLMTRDRINVMSDSAFAADGYDSDSGDFIINPEVIRPVYKNVYEEVTFYDEGRSFKFAKISSGNYVLPQNVSTNSEPSDWTDVTYYRFNPVDFSDPEKIPTYEVGRFFYLNSGTFSSATNEQYEGHSNIYYEPIKVKYPVRYGNNNNFEKIYRRDKVNNVELDNYIVLNTRPDDWPETWEDSRTAHFYYFAGQEIEKYRISDKYLRKVGYGGKVDIYVRGSDYTLQETTETIDSPKYLLGIEVSNIDTQSHEGFNGDNNAIFYLTADSTGKTLEYIAPASWATRIYKPGFNNSFTGKDLRILSENNEPIPVIGTQMVGVGGYAVDSNDNMNITVSSNAKLETLIIPQDKDGNYLPDMSGTDFQFTICLSDYLTSEGRCIISSKRGVSGSFANLTPDFDFSFVRTQNKHIIFERVEQNSQSPVEKDIGEVEVGSDIYVQISATIDATTGTITVDTFYCKDNLDRFTFYRLFNSYAYSLQSLEDGPEFRIFSVSLSKSGNAESDRVLISKASFFRAASSTNQIRTEKDFKDFDMIDRSEASRSETVGPLEEGSETTSGTSALDDYDNSITGVQNNIKKFTLGQNYDELNQENNQNESRRHSVLSIPIATSWNSVSVSLIGNNNWATRYFNYFKEVNSVKTVIAWYDIFKSAANESYIINMPYWERDRLTNTFTQATDISDYATFNARKSRLYVLDLSGLGDTVYTPQSNIVDSGQSGRMVYARYAVKLNYAPEFYQNDGDYMELGVMLKTIPPQDGLVESTGGVVKIKSGVLSSNILEERIRMTRTTSGAVRLARDYLGLPDVTDWTSRKCREYAQQHSVYIEDCYSVSEQKRRIKVNALAEKYKKIYNLTYQSINELVIYVDAYDYAYQLGDMTYYGLKKVLKTVLADNYMTTLRYAGIYALKSFASRIGYSLTKTTANEIRQELSDEIGYNITRSANNYIAAATSTVKTFSVTMNASNQVYDDDFFAPNVWIWVKTVINLENNMYSIYAKTTEPTEELEDLAGYIRIGQPKRLEITNPYSIGCILFDHTWCFQTKAENPSMRYVQSENNYIEVKDIAISTCYDSMTREEGVIKKYSGSDPMTYQEESVGQGVYTLVADGKDTNNAVLLISDTKENSSYTFHYFYTDGETTPEESEIKLYPLGMRKLLDDGKWYQEVEISSPSDALYSAEAEYSDGYDNADITSNAKIVHKNLQGEILTDDDILYQSSQEKTTVLVEQPDMFIINNSGEEGVPHYYSDAPYISGKQMIVRYSTNLDVASLGTRYNQSGDRIITTDVLVKESPKTYINLWLEVAPNEKSLSDGAVSEMMTAIKRYIDGLSINASIQMSDIIANLANQSAFSNVDYIKLPFRSFYVTENDFSKSGDASVVDKNYDNEDTLSAGENRYFALGACKITIIN